MEINFGEVCRTCLNKSTDFKSINKPTTDAVTFAKMIEYCTSIQIEEGDRLPSKICEPCVILLEASFKFKKQTEKANSTLKRYLREQVECSQQTVTDVAAHVEDMDPVVAVKREETTASAQVVDVDSDSEEWEVEQPKKEVFKKECKSTGLSGEQDEKVKMIADKADPCENQCGVCKYGLKKFVKCDSCNLCFHQSCLQVHMKTRRKCKRHTRKYSDPAGIYWTKNMNGIWSKGGEKAKTTADDRSDPRANQCGVCRYWLLKFVICDVCDLCFHPSCLKVHMKTRKKCKRPTIKHLESDYSD